jgi:hypothetical protein
MRGSNGLAMSDNTSEEECHVGNRYLRRGTGERHLRVPIKRPTPRLNADPRKHEPPRQAKVGRDAGNHTTIPSQVSSNGALSPRERLTANTTLTRKGVIGATGVNASLLTPVPEPGHTPFNFLSESPALPNWKEATKEMLQREFGGMNFKTFEDAQEHFRSYLRTLKDDDTRQAFADRMRDRARKNFYRREYARPTYSYTPDDKENLKRGAAPGSGLQLEHLQDVKSKEIEGLKIEGRPELALDPENIYFSKGGPRGTAPRGSKHAEKYRTIKRAIETSREVRERAVQQSKEEWRVTGEPLAPDSKSGPAEPSGSWESKNRDLEPVNKKANLFGSRGLPFDVPLDAAQMIGPANTQVALTFIFDIGSKDPDALSRSEIALMYKAGYTLQSNVFAPKEYVWALDKGDTWTDEAMFNAFGVKGPNYIIPGLDPEYQLHRFQAGRKTDWEERLDEGKNSSLPR